MKLSIIIPAYARHPLTVRNVEETMKSTRVPDEIIVVNDGGDPSLRDMLFSLPRNTNIIYARVEEDILWNYNGAVNLGCWLSTGDVLGIQDTDHIPARETFAIGLKTLENRPEVGRISFGRNIVQIADMNKPMEEWKSTGSLGTNQMVALLRRDVYLTLKGQDERLCGRYGYMSYDFPYRRDKILGVISQKENYYWAVFGDQGEPGLRRGLHPENKRIYHENAIAGKNHSMHGILNFHFTYERF